MRYSIIYADPPWAYRDKLPGPKRGAEKHYTTLTTEVLCGLAVSRLAAADSFLFLWATFPNIIPALRVMEAWGFQYKTCAFLWVKLDRSGKPSFGMGHYTRGGTEPCLLGIRGKPHVVARNVPGTIMAPRGSHSAKPPQVREQIVRLCGDVSRIELFARNSGEGWDATGLEYDSADIKDFLGERVAG